MSARPSPLLRFDVVDRLISAIYDGPTESPPWDTALLQLCDILRAKHVTLILRPPSSDEGGAMVNTPTVRNEATAAYQTRFFALDPFVGLPDDRVVTPEEVVGAKAWRASALYRDYLRPLDVEYLMGADLHTVTGIECRLRISRSRAQRPFSADERRLCNLLLPHLKRSIRLHARLDKLQGDRLLFAGVIDRLQLGMVTLTRNGAVLDVNPEAKRILDDHDGLRLQSGALKADDTHGARQLRSIVREALAGAGGTVEALSLKRPSGRPSLGVVVRATAPLDRTRHSPAAVVYLRDPLAGGAPASQEILRRLFGLAPTQAALALHLAEGLTLDQAAVRMKVTKNTARTYLRLIFAKAGVARQSDLVRVLLNSVATLA